MFVGDREKGAEDYLQIAFLETQPARKSRYERYRLSAIVERGSERKAGPWIFKTRRDEINGVKQMLLIILRPGMLNQLGNVLKITPEVLNGEALWIFECGDAYQVRLRCMNEYGF
jgi:hypothetical protein